VHSDLLHSDFLLALVLVRLGSLSQVIRVVAGFIGQHARVGVWRFVWGASIVYFVAPAIRAAAASDRDYVSPTPRARFRSSASVRSATALRSFEPSSSRHGSV